MTTEKWDVLDRRERASGILYFDSIIVAGIVASEVGKV
jgi:hypothetical protein